MKPHGWVLFYATRRVVETGDFLEMLGGAGPLVIRHDGRSRFLPGEAAAEPTNAELETKNGLKA